MRNSDRVDYSLHSKVQTGDVVYRPAAIDAGFFPGKIYKRTVEKVQSARAIILKANSKHSRQTVTSQSGFQGWRKTWDEAFKVGQQQLEDHIAHLELRIQEAGKALKKWDKLKGPVGP